MKDKDLSRLRRSELLEILVAQSDEIDQLHARIAELEQKLNSREIEIQNAGSLAAASLALSNIFVDAQRAADLYLYNVRRMADNPENK